MKTVGIYQIRNKVNGKVYIGSSVWVENRLVQHRSHLRSGKHCNGHLQNSWNHYGEAAFEFAVVEIMGNDEQMLREREEQLIQQLGASDRSQGYNIETTPSTSSKSQEHKEAISKALKKKYAEGYINPYKGKARSKEFGAKIASALRGRKQSPDLVERRIKAIRKAICQYDLSGNFVQEFGSIREASEVLGIKVPNLVRACKSSSRTAKGSIFRYKDTP